MRTLMQWLAEAGHECRVLATARFDAKPPDDIDGHLTSFGVPMRRSPPSRAFTRSVRKPSNVVVGRPTVDFTLAGVRVTMLMTRQNDPTRPDPFERDQFLFLLEQILKEFNPAVLVSYGGHPVVREALRHARRRRVTTVYSLRNYGYDDRGWFEHVDHVFTCSPYLSAFYREKIGLISTGIESPIEWDEALAPSEMRRFVTFVNPLPAKGAAVFGRLADMLGSRRPDIPLLVVQSASTAGHLNAIPGLDFGKYPHIMAAPATSSPAEYFALTRILLAPSVFPEPFGRVAVEAMINGIPPLVSNRGALPETVAGAGRVLPIPDWLTPNSMQPPSVEEMEPWFEAVCSLWDDPAAYAEASRLARETAERLYSEPTQRQRYHEYFTSLKPGGRLFE